MVSIKRLLLLLVDMDMEPSDLCRACGVTPVQLSRLRRGDIDLDALDAICSYLEVQPSDLMDLV